MPSERLSPTQLDTQQQEHLAAIADIERRFDAVDVANQREDAVCFLNTLAFTHPDLLPNYTSYPFMPNLLLWAVATETALLSGEEIERRYFGQTDMFDFEPHFTKEDLTHLLDGVNALWFGTADVSGDPEGFNHIIGVVPYRSPLNPESMYMVHDTSGHIDFEPQNIDDLYSSIAALPHSDQYMQSVFAFRNATVQDNEPNPDLHEYMFFTPPSSPQ